MAIKILHIINRRLFYFKHHAGNDVVLVLLEIIIYYTTTSFKQNALCRRLFDHGGISTSHRVVLPDN
jgi:hypothetical protein